MAKPTLVANWKNYPGSIEEARTLLRELSKKRLLYKKTCLFIAPPAAYMEEVASRAKGFALLASQDISSLPKGTYTGELTPEILKSFGVKLSIIGHSERRALGETIEDMRDKIKAALKAGIAPLVCFGEKERDKDGEHFEFLRDELKHIFSGFSKVEIRKMAMAYEPVWAVGKDAKEVIEPAELSQTIIFIKKVLSDLFGRDVAEKLPILYGGSVDEKNAKELFKSSGVKGFLVGRVSLKAKDFLSVAEAITTK